jgi:FtsZ-binding cell division protein ZapB
MAITGLSRIVAAQTEQKAKMGLPADVYEENSDAGVEQVKLLKLIFQYMKETNKEISKKFQEIQDEQKVIADDIADIKKKINS